MNRRPSQFKIQKYIYKPMVGIGNTNHGLIEKCHTILDTFMVGHYVNRNWKKENGNNKSQSAIVITGIKRVKRFLDVFGDCLAKEKQVTLVRKWIESRIGKYRQIPYSAEELHTIEEIYKANQRGILRDFTPDTQVV